MTSVTEESKRVFIQYWEDKGNWSGTPLVGGNVGGTKEERGNLTQLKRAGLISTFDYDGEVWIQFTDKGEAFAENLGLSD